MTGDFVLVLDVVWKYVLTSLLGVVFGVLCGSVRKLWVSQKALKKGTQSLLRADIIRCYEKYLEKGYCPIYARDALEAEYKSYHDLGGNGTITSLWERIQALPTEKRDDE